MYMYISKSQNQGGGETLYKTDMVICCLNNNLEINWKSVLDFKKSTSTLQLFNWINTKPCSSYIVYMFLKQVVKKQIRKK